jgi:hypothetical protein
MEGAPQEQTVRLARVEVVSHTLFMTHMACFAVTQQKFVSHSCCNGEIPSPSSLAAAARVVQENS